MQQKFVWCHIFDRNKKNKLQYFSSYKIIQFKHLKGRVIILKYKWYSQKSSLLHWGLFTPTSPLVSAPPFRQLFQRNSQNSQKENLQKTISFPTQLNSCQHAAIKHFNEVVSIHWSNISLEKNTKVVENAVWRCPGC